MHIHITEDAKQRLLQMTNKHNKQLQLAYDTSGCGCAVSGVPSLWLIEQTDGLENAGDQQLPIFYKKQQAVFFEPNLYLSYNESQNGFRLSSNNQIYQNAMTVQHPPSDFGL